MCLQQVGAARVDARDREAAVKDKEQFLASEADNNREEEKKISAIERTTAKLKQELQDAERLRDTFNSDVSRTDRQTDGPRHIARHLQQRREY